jgi:energy-coupling factor transport system ATP-binding protein
MIVLENVSFTYKGQSSPAIDNLSLTIGDGEFVGVAGPCSAGKSTFACLLNGVIPHHYEGDFYGMALVDGMDTVNTSLTGISRVVGSVFEDINAQMVSSTVEDEILFALINFGLPMQEVDRRAQSALADMGISNLRYRNLDTLSGGQKQKVALAAVMAVSPKVLVLDEPTGELDPASSIKVYELLRQINRMTGTTIIAVEQKLDLICQYADRLLVMDRGRVVLDGPARDVLGNAAALGEIGLKRPPVMDLFDELSRLGLYEGAPPLTIDEAEQMVRGAMA